MNTHTTPYFDDLLSWAASWLLLACAAWAAMICAAALAEAASSGRFRATAWVGCPPGLRRALLAGLGVALVSAPAQASPPPPAGSTPSPSGYKPASAWLRGLPSPARPPDAASPTAHVVVVRPGDTLWGLARDRLAASASSRAVADLVALLHHRNRSVIGPDPDLIRPDQRLVVPRADEPPEATRSDPTLTDHR